MSTPSTATATLPPHQYFSPHHQYQSSISNGQVTNGSTRLGNPTYTTYPTSTSNSDLRRTATTHARQTQLAPPAATMATANRTGRPPRQRNKTDWEQFYKNGIPKEIIVIDDDDDEPPPARQPQTARTNGTNTRHTDKKRKTTTSTAYDPIYHHHNTSYSTTQTPYADSPRNTISTDRTTSALNTTAATSLGSNGSNGAYAAPLDNGVVGQKRKRTRQAALDEAKQAKRREIDVSDDPFSLYAPPPHPPIKAKEVFVQVIPDVSSASGGNRLMTGHTLTPHRNRI
jgi:dual-specificity kinase